MSEEIKILNNGEWTPAIIELAKKFGYTVSETHETIELECFNPREALRRSLAHIDALQAEVARLTEELKATKLARGQPEHYTVELIEARAEVARLQKRMIGMSGNLGHPVPSDMVFDPEPHEGQNILAQSIAAYRNALMVEVERLREAVGTLFDKIKHGDDVHQVWLKKAIDDHFDHCHD